MEAIASVLAGPCRNFFGYIMSLEKNINSLQKEMGEVKSRREKLMEEVQVAKRWGWEPSISIEEWLNHARRFGSDAAKIQAEWEQRVGCLGDCSVNVLWSYDLSKRAEEKSEEATGLKSQLYPFNELASQMVPARLVKMTGAPLIGRESVLGQLRHLVGDKNVGIIGIHGMGGVGKTALLEALHNEFLAEFAVIWIRTSESRSVDEIQAALRNQLGLSWVGHNTQTERATILLGALSKMEFMLILDGLWEHLDLRTVGIPTPDRQSGSKIILTTRIETVCDGMDAEKIKVECLAWQEAWDLFERKAGKVLTSESNSQIRDCAGKLADKCGGLPLALTAVGRGMASQKTAEEWKYAVTFLDTKPWEVPGMEEVLQRLKLSYQELCRHSKLRTCLVYASLIDDFFDRVGLIDYCMGEGVIDDVDDPEGAYNTGHRLLGMLKAASLLEDDLHERQLRVHPMIRRMVIWAECGCGKQENKLLVRTGSSLEAAPKVERWREATRISLTRNEIATLPESPDCPELLTLFLHHNSRLTRIPSGLFQCMPKLKVLDLSFTSIRGLPPGIASLVGLQLLNLRQTKITSLPAELGLLTNLRFLLLHSTHRLQITEGVIARLAALRVLQMYGSYTIRKASSWEGGLGVEDIERLSKLTVLGITLGTLSALQRLSESRRLAAAMRDLYMWDCSEMTTIQLPCATIGRNMESLQCLRLSGCCNLEEVIVGDDAVGHGGDERSLLPCLQTFTLRLLPITKIIWKSKSLQNLKYIYIWDCKRIEELMDFEDEEARGDGGGCEPFVTFPNLVEIKLEDLPKFGSLSIGGRALAFPSLTSLRVKNCPKLKKLTLVSDNLVEVRGEKKWWDALEWENANIKSSFRFKTLEGGNY